MSGNAALNYVGQEMLGAALFLMCDDRGATMKSLEAKGVPCTEIQTQPWGASTTIPLPSGGKIGL